MRLTTIAAALLLTTASPAFAQSLETLTEALGHLPEAILANPVPDQAYFVDLDALRSLTAGDFGARSLMRTQVGAGLRAIDSLHMSGVAAWEEKSGVAFDEVQYFAGFGSTPDTVTIWGLADDAATADLLDALVERDFVPLGTGGVLGNGEPMAADLRNRNPADPWRSMVGAASFAAAKTNAVVQTTSPEALLMITAAQPAVAGNPIVATAINGLGEAIGDGLVIQAMLISPAFGLGTIDPAEFILPQSRNFDDVRSTLEASMDASLEGIAPYFAGIIADAQLDGPAVALSLTYGDCETAQAATLQIEQRWAQSMPESAQGSITTGTLEGGGLCAATVIINGDNLDPTANPIFNAFYESYTRRQFTVLQIGHAS